MPTSGDHSCKELFEQLTHLLSGTSTVVMFNLDSCVFTRHHVLYICEGSSHPAVTAVDQLAQAVLHRGVTVELERIFLFYKKRKFKNFCVC
jgi:hypothetical protein